jgi:hypothetical protein
MQNVIYTNEMTLWKRWKHVTKLEMKWSMKPISSHYLIQSTEDTFWRRNLKQQQWGFKERKIDHDKIAQERRDQKATKTDDAEVPEYLWLEHLVQDGKIKLMADEIMRLSIGMHMVQARCL